METADSRKKDKRANRLHPAQLPGLPPGKYHDGAGLYLVVSPRSASRSWVFKYGFGGRQRDMGLGALDLSSTKETSTGLADAREKAADARKLLKAGKDPQDERKRLKAEEAARKAKEAAEAVTFREMAERHVEAIAPQWTNPKHAKQWPATLKTYAYDLIGDMMVKHITTAHVVRCLYPIWATKRATARRLRGRLEAVMQAAILLGFREGPNPVLPARDLERAGLPRRPRGPKKHFPSLPYLELPAFMKALENSTDESADALAFLILTVVRSGNVYAATWDEIDMERARWIPGRMKMGNDHEVPLSEPAMAVLRKRGKGKGYVFPGREKGSHISDATMLQLIKRMHKDEIAAGRKGWLDPKTKDAHGRPRIAVPHGFRNAAESWLLNRRPNTPDKVRKAFLAHVVSDDTEAAYGRDVMEALTELMNAWAAYAMGGT